jgi:hypothetical protein
MQNKIAFCTSTSRTAILLLFWHFKELGINKNKLNILCRWIFSG